MNILIIDSVIEIPENYTGIVGYKEGDKHWYREGKRHREDGPALEYSSGTKFWYINGDLHREDGPACEYSDGQKLWLLKGREYFKINLNNYIVLDYDKGEYGLMWYRLLGKDEIVECPDIPGLITK